VLTQLRHKVAGVPNDNAHFPIKPGADMIRKICNGTIMGTIVIALAVSATAAAAQKRHAPRIDANGNLDSLIARHAAANNLPEDLVRRIIKRESGGNPRVVSKGNFGLMQIKLATARSMGYQGSAAGLLDADTNMTYAVKYLAGAYRVADGNANRAVHYYAAGYYYAAKSKGGVALKNDNPFNAFASATPGNAMTTARAEGLSVSSSSDLYSGRLDIH
jgi:soluble lytic murein transglycosylase-like protein